MEVGFEGFCFGDEVLEREVGLVVGGFAAEDGGEVGADRRGDRRVGIVSVADMFAELTDIGLSAGGVEVGFIAAVGFFSLEEDARVVIRFEDTVGTVGAGDDLVFDFGYGLDAGEGESEVIGEAVVEGKVIEDAAFGADLEAASAGSGDGVGVGDPGGDIEGMDTLFHDEVAADCADVVPGAELFFR